MLKNFPETLQADICLYLNDKLLSDCLAFRSASPGHRHLTIEYCNNCVSDRKRAGIKFEANDSHISVTRFGNVSGNVSRKSPLLVSRSLFIRPLVRFTFSSLPENFHRVTWKQLQDDTSVSRFFDEQFTVGANHDFDSHSVRCQTVAFSTLVLLRS